MPRDTLDTGLPPRTDFRPAARPYISAGEAVGLAIDVIEKACEGRDAAAGCRPGERLVDGRVYVFNADLLNKHVACEAVLNAPSDLTTLSDDDLGGLRYRCLKVWGMSQNDPMKTIEVRLAEEALSIRIECERVRRGWVV